MYLRLRSFGFALNGIRLCFFSEANFRIHLLAASLAVGGGCFFGISRAEWLMVLVAIGLVLMAELFNTAIEQLCNLVSPGTNRVVGVVKDLSAAAVLIASVMAAAIACLVFIPHF